MSHAKALIRPSFWAGTCRNLSGHGPYTSAVAIYAMTCHHRIAANEDGSFYLPVAYIAHDLGISQELARNAITNMVAVNFCAYDADSEQIKILGDDSAVMHSAGA